MVFSLRFDVSARSSSFTPFADINLSSILGKFTAQMEYYTQRIADTEGWTMVGLYADEGITGTSTKKRTQFNKMIRDAEKGKIDIKTLEMIQSLRTIVEKILQKRSISEVFRTF